MDGLPTDPIPWMVLAARFLLPLLIPRFPLPGIFLCFVADAVDETVLYTFTDVDLEGYQSYDKAFDVYYLAIAMLATLRNWLSCGAVQVARFLFYLRLVGVFLFELAGWRPLLLFFPNAFEYFFILYEGIRTRWEPERVGVREWRWAAALIWVAIKIPQESWLHVARLDMTELIRFRLLGGRFDERSGELIAHLLLVTGALGLAAVGVEAVRRFAPPPHCSFRLAAGPMPAVMRDVSARALHVARRLRLVDMHLVEKTVLVGCLTVIFLRILPGVDAPTLPTLAGVAIFVAINSFVQIRVSGRWHALPAFVGEFLATEAINLSLVLAADRLLLQGKGAVSLPAAILAVTLLTLVVRLYDAWRPAYDARLRQRPLT